MRIKINFENESIFIQNFKQNQKIKTTIFVEIDTNYPMEKIK